MTVTLTSWPGAGPQGKAVLGEDFSMALGGGADGDEANLFDRGWKESVAWTGSGGLLVRCCRQNLEFHGRQAFFQRIRISTRTSTPN